MSTDTHNVHRTNKIDPLHQFSVKKIIQLDIDGYDISLTNSSIAMLSSAVLFIGIFYILTRVKRGANNLVPTLGQSIVEMLYNFVNNMVQSVSSDHASKRCVYFIFSIFVFIMFANIVGLIPFSFAPTSQIIVTFGLAIITFCGTILISIAKHGFSFYKIFIPRGIPWWMMPIMMPLELFSYLAKPVSLSVRLAANMIAGHVMIEIVAVFVAMMGIFGFLPFVFLIILTMFEIFICLLQAYIFALLASVYIGQVLDH